MIRSEVLAKPDGQKFAKALAGAWYEMLGMMSAKGPAADKVLAAIAEGSGDTLASYKEQLSTTKMFYTPQSAVQFGKSPELKQKMALVRQFCFDHGLLGAKTRSPDDVAIEYPDGSKQGKPDRVRLASTRLIWTWQHRGSCDDVFRILSDSRQTRTHIDMARFLGAVRGGPRGILHRC